VLTETPRQTETEQKYHPEEHGSIEDVFETVLYYSRFLVVIAVLGILVAAAVMFVKGTFEVVQGVRAFVSMIGGWRPTPLDDNSVILAFIPALDNYLFATILLLISTGLYELFISKIDPRCRRDYTRPVHLVIKTLDDLKSKIGEVVVMILVVNFFKVSFSITYGGTLDLLILGGAILLVAGALLVTHYASVLSRRRVSKE
jgi:uncharacterized membrane protein YqhA